MDLYEVSIRNVPFEQAQALYRVLVNLSDGEPMVGTKGSTWSGVIPGTRVNLETGAPRDERIVTISPMQKGQHA